MPIGIMPKSASEPIYCNKCRKTMAQTNYYTYKDGSKCELCKNCLTLHINNFEEETFLWLLEKFDVPYVPAEWNVLRDRAYQKDPYKMTGMSVFGKYLSKMKLKQWKNFTWADTERLQAEAEERAKLYGQPEEIAQQKIQEIKEAHERGEITDAQWMTYKEINNVADVQPIPPQQPVSPQDDFYPSNNDTFVKVDLPDVSEQLTDEDKIYLATKWGRLYSAADWIYLEQKYNDFMESFDIQGAARIDTLIQICKVSLKSNQALDSGDMDSYSKLVRAYDALMKSAKFTEAQRKEEKNGEFDAVGQIVYFAEKEKGKISRYKITQPLDIVDKAIDNLKRYTKELIENDSTLSQQIENYLKKKEGAEAHKLDLQEAEKDGREYIEIQDEDYAEFNKLLEEGNEDES